MPGHSVRALLCGIVLVPLAWIGIVLVGKLHGKGMLVPVLAVCGVVVLADVAVALISISRSRRHRIERTAEPKLGRR
jgi:uncharacterized membrane protein